jgi:HK97 family phage prohead protease
MKHIKFDFETKSSSKGLVIEGFANANTFDRCKERIDPAGWSLDNYKKNPVILFDHGHDMAFGSMPIGKAIAIEPREGGLFIKAAISQSKTEKISAVRDLIEEGILKTFSVGFNPMENEKSGDGIVITKAELIENSVVPVPMNQDSVFSISNRSFKSALATDWFNQYCKSADLFRKGAKFAAIVTNEMRKSGKSLIDLVTELKSHGFTEEQVLSILDGYDLLTIKEKKTVESFANVIGISPTVFDTIEIKGDNEMPVDPKKPVDGEEPCTTEEGCSSPKKKELTTDELKAAMEEMAAECNGIVAETPTTPSWATDEQAFADAKLAADQVVSKEDAIKYYAVLSWLYYNKLSGKKETPPASSEGDAETPPPEGESKAGVSQNEKMQMPSGDAAAPMNENPHLELAKQTNVLLGTLINEIQKIGLKLESIGEEETEPEDTTPPAPETAPVLNSDDEEKKLIANIRKTHEDLRKRIKRL